MTIKKLHTLILPLALTLLAAQAHAASVQLSGQVTLADLAPEGEPTNAADSVPDSVVVGGAMITVTDSRGVSVTTYSAANGAWELKQDSLQPPLTLRARAGAAYADTTLNIEPGAQSSIILQLEKLTDPKAISARLTASAHASAVDWQDADTKQDFISQCHFCHQIGNASTRVEKTEEQWRDTLERMQGYGAMLTWQNEDDFAKTLSANFNGEPVPAVRTLEMHDGLPGSVMREWSFGGPINYVHDIEISKEDGLIYGVDMSADKIWILDRTTNEIEDVQWPANDLPLGGMFAGAVALSNQVGRLDPETREFTIIDLPSNGAWRWVADAMLPTILKAASWFGKEDMHVALSHHKITGEGRDVLNLPYGIDVNPIDGMIWYSKLYAGRIGKIDPKTLEVTEFETPYPAPRRLRFAKDGTLWIPSFESGVLMKFDPATEIFTESYELPVLAKGEYETPYAVAVEPDTQHVWIAANMSDRILRFDPVAETFQAYPSPQLILGT